MKNARNIFTNFFFILLLLTGCKEFYDEEFEQEVAQGSTSNGTNEENVSYTATLNSSSPNITTLNGSSSVNIDGDTVNIQVQVDGIPDNLLQVHYGFIAAACNALSVAVPNAGTGTKSYNLTEQTTINSLNQDLVTSGANTVAGDIDLSNKSFVVKAFASVNTGTPATIGNAVIVACGDLNVSTDTGGATTTGTTTGTTGTGTTTGTTTGTDTTGTTGTFDPTTGTSGTFDPSETTTGTFDPDGTTTIGF